MWAEASCSSRSLHLNPHASCHSEINPFLSNYTYNVQEAGSFSSSAHCDFSYTFSLYAMSPRLKTLLLFQPREVVCEAVELPPLLGPLSIWELRPRHFSNITRAYTYLITRPQCPPVRARVRPRRAILYKPIH